MSDENRSQQVSLGCGTLILIALIVLIFSNRGTGGLEREIGVLKNQISELKEMVASQSKKIDRLSSGEPTRAP